MVYKLIEMHCQILARLVLTLLLGFLFLQLNATNCYVLADETFYFYDSLNRLIEIRYPDKIVRYTYDAAGNRLSQSIEIIVPAPDITGFSPRGAVAGGASFELRILGSNFNESSVVQWNGTSRPTSFVGPNEIRATIGATDVATIGTSAVVVANSTPSASLSIARAFPVVQTAAVSGQITAGGSPLSGVNVNLTGPDAISVTTDNSGSFSFAVLPTGNYTITPSRTNYSFTPASRTLSYTGAAQSNLNFEASLVSYTISGRVATAAGNGVGGVAIAMSGSSTATTTTDASGNYSLTATAEGNYTITPSFSGYTFSPASQTYSALGANQTGNFVATASRRSPFDFDGDGKTDVSIFRPAGGEWWYLRSSDGGNGALQFGQSTDKLAPADFTGDGKTDIAFFQPSNGFWFVLRSEDFSFFSFPFGAAGDIPAPADYDGDGKADPAVFRPSSSTWFISKSTGGTSIVQFGTTGDQPVNADYDGDGKSDIAIFRPSDGSWWYVRSSDGAFRVFQFGQGTDKPVQGDYTGDGKADIAVYRATAGVWFIQRSEDNTFFSFPFGSSGDVPVPGDYDGDGKFDSAVFRPSTSTWYLNRTTAGVAIVGFGIAGDQPIPSAFLR